MSEYEEFVRCHLHRRVSSSSVFIPVQGLPYNHGSDKHDIVFNHSPLRGYWCSEPTEITLFSDWDELFFDIKNKTIETGDQKELPNRILNDLYMALSEEEIKISKQYLLPNKQKWPWKLISDILVQHFNSSLLLINLEKI